MGFRLGRRVLLPINGMHASLRLDVYDGYRKPTRWRNRRVYSDFFPTGPRLQVLTNGAEMRRNWAWRLTGPVVLFVFH